MEDRSKVVAELQDLMNQSLETQAKLALQGMFTSMCEKYGKERGIDTMIELFSDVRNSI